MKNWESLKNLAIYKKCYENLINSYDHFEKPSKIIFRKGHVDVPPQQRFLKLVFKFD